MEICVLALIVGGTSIRAADAAPQGTTDAAAAFARSLAEYDNNLGDARSTERKKQLLALVRAAQAATGESQYDVACAVIARIASLDKDLANSPDSQPARDRLAMYHRDLTARLEKPCPGPPTPEPTPEPLPATVSEPTPSDSAPTTDTSAEPPETAPPPTTTPSSSSPTDASRGPVSPASPGPAATFRRPRAWTIGGAIALTLGAGFLGMMGAGVAKSVQARHIARTGDPVWNELRDSANAWNRTAVAGGILAGAAIVSGVTLLALTHKRRTRIALYPRWRLTASGVVFAF